MPKFNLLLITALIILPTHVAFATDTQFWNTYSVSKSLTPPWTFFAEEEFRIGDNAGELTYNHLDFGLRHETSDWLELGIHYRYIKAWKRLLWETENRPYGNATVKGKWKGWELSNRSQVENRFLSDTKDFWRYTNKTKIQVSINIDGREIKPYVSEEYFIDFDQPEFNYNRISFGIETEFMPNMTGEIYYLRQDQDDRGIEPKADVIGLAFRYHF